MTFGEDLGWGSSVEESQQIIDRYIELGGNFIDTANFYTKSHSRRSSAITSGATRARRDRLVIATKFSGNLYPGDPNGGGSGRKSIVSACENSLRRLQTDYIDLYWLHNWDAPHADRRDHGRARGSRARRQGALPRRLRTRRRGRSPRPT